MTNMYSDISDTDTDISLQNHIRNHILSVIDLSNHIRILTDMVTDIFSDTDTV